MSFTPGPWKLDVRVGCVAVYPDNQDHNCLSDASEWAIHYKSGYQVKDENGNFVRWEVPEEDIANARLIAAAPDLLAACEMVLTFVESIDCFTPWRCGLVPDVEGELCDRCRLIEKLKVVIAEAHGEVE